MFRVRREDYKCPKCGESLPEVSNVEVSVNRRDVVLSVCMGLGFGLFISAAWYVTWWGALGVAFIVACLTFLVQAGIRGRKSRMSRTPKEQTSAEGKDSTRD